MRISAVPAEAMAQLGDPRRAGHAAASRPLPFAGLSPALPGAIADRLAVLMAQDPGLAEAVSARLPAARLDSARDLATYGPPAPGPTIDIRS
jgi:hypothetical protein